MPHYLSDMRIPPVRPMSWKGKRSTEREREISRSDTATTWKFSSETCANIAVAAATWSAFPRFGDGLINARRAIRDGSILDRELFDLIYTAGRRLRTVSRCETADFEIPSRALLARTDGETRWYRPTLRCHADNCIINPFSPPLSFLPLYTCIRICVRRCNESIHARFREENFFKDNFFQSLHLE